MDDGAGAVTQGGKAPVTNEEQAADGRPGAGQLRSFLSCRVLSLGHVVEPEDFDFESCATTMTLDGADHDIVLRRHRYKLYSSIETCLRIDFADPALARRFICDDIAAEGLELRSVHGLLDGSGMLRIVKVLETARDLVGLDLECVNRMHFAAAATSAEDHHLYTALVATLTRLRLGRALSKLPLDSAVPRTELDNGGTAYLAEAFDHRPWRCCLFLVSPSDLEMATRDAAPDGVFGRVRTEEYFAPLANGDRSGERWYRGRVGRLTDKNGMYCLADPEVRTDTDTILQLMASFLLPISMKTMLETSRFNILDMADRMIRKVPGFSGPVAMSYLTRTRLRYAQMLKWRSFLSSQQKVIHDKNVDYYQIDKELALLGEDAGALRTAVEVERMDASERFARLATWFALGLSLLSVASTMTAVAQFYLDDRVALDPMVRVWIIVGGPLSLIALFIVVFGVARLRLRRRA